MVINLNFNILFPEIFFILVSSIIFLVDKFISNKNYAFYFTLIAIAFATFFLLFTPFGVFTKAYQSDFFSATLKLLLLFGAFLVVLVSYSYLQTFNRMNYGEYYGLILFSLVGSFLMLSAMDLITIDLSMELMSFPVYFLIALHFVEDRKSLEGALKYFLLGSLGSVFFLIGIGIIYYLTHTVDLILFSKLVHGVTQKKLLLLGFLFLLGGFSIKLALVPFHMWSPDAYESAPLPITSFIAGLVKFVVMATLVKVIILGFGELKLSIADLLLPIALLSIFVGNVLAIKQDDIVRMLAYSSIAHAGYALLGLVAGDYIGYSFTIFYMFVYMIMTIGVFAVLVALAQKDKKFLRIPELKGLSKSSGFLSFLLLVFMFSLAGIPPTGGFIAKLYLFLALIKTEHIVTAIIAILLSVIGAYPYLRVLKVVYMEPSQEKVEFSYGTTFLIPAIVTTALILLIGIFPKPWTELVYKTVFFYVTMLFYVH